MNTTPDTETDEELEELLDAICNTRVYDDRAAMREAAAPILAGIRRHAAAEALNEQGNSLTKTGRRMREQARAHDAKGKRDSSIIYNSLADAYYGSASRLWKAADDKIAEGYPFECAAFRQECETRVPDAGDYCSKHEPEDDENPWED